MIRRDTLGCHAVWIWMSPNHNMTNIYEFMPTSKSLRLRLVVVEGEGWLPNIITLQKKLAVLLSLAIESVTKCNALLLAALKSPVLWSPSRSFCRGKSWILPMECSIFSCPQNPWAHRGTEPFGRIGIEELSVQVIGDATTILSLRHHVLNGDLKRAERGAGKAWPGEFWIRICPFNGLT